MSDARCLRRSLCALTLVASASAADYPLLKNFLGINGDFNFPSATFRPVCPLARMYHSTTWDVSAPGGTLHVPVCINGVNWDRDTYGPWKTAGFTTDASVQVEGFTTGWSGKETWCNSYGHDLASYFGPSGTHQQLSSIEIGNEPGSQIDVTTYKMILKNMAQGIRAGDPNVKILTPYVKVGAASTWNQDVRVTYADSDILPLYDALNVHTYPFAPARAYPNNNTFNQSYPEDPTLTWLTEVDDLITWRNANASGKEIWVTEYGYNAVTQTAINNRTGWWLDSNWQSMSDLMQAQYFVRAVMALTERGVNRAYAFFYNDGDVADGPFGGAGLTRNGTPKMSFWAMKQVYDQLGEYRFKRVVTKIAGDRCVYEFEKGSDTNALIWVVWSPTGTRSDTKAGYTPRTAAVTLTSLPGTVQQVSGMASASGAAPSPAYTASGSQIALTIGESPIYIAMTVSSTNHVPTITTAKPAAVSCLEDGFGDVSLTATDTDGDVLTWTVTTSGSKGVTSVSAMGSGASATVHYVASANLIGSDNVGVTVSDGHGGSDTIIIIPTITAVNDVPAFTAGSAISVAFNSGPQVVSGWTTSITAGPSDEAGQVMHFVVVSNSNPALFTVGPTVSAAGDLTFTSATDVSGVAVVGLHVVDDGGVAHGGTDTSATQTVTITVNAGAGSATAAPADSGSGGGGGCGFGGGLALMLAMSLGWMRRGRMAPDGQNSARV